MRLQAPWLLLALVPAAAVLAGGWAIALARRRPGRLALALRSAAAALLALCAAGLLVPSGGRPRALVLLDRSASMAPARRQALAAARAAGSALSGRFQVRYGSFAASARGEESLGALSRLVPDEAGTDLAAALAFARRALRPGEPAVLVTDGLATVPGARGAALGWGERSPALVLIPAGPDRPDAALAELDAPAEVRPGERFALSVRASGSAAKPVRVVLTRTVAGGVPAEAGSAEINLPARGHAVRSVLFEDAAPVGGLIEYTATLTAPGDAEPGNNAARALVRVAGRLRVGVISPGASPAVPALRAAGMDAERLVPARLPGKLSRFGALVLDGVPREKLSEKSCAGLAGYVKLGGGLVVLGGPDSYARGGYSDGGPLESALPASVRPPAEEGLFAVLVLDRSGSMGRASAPGGGSKLTLAKRAAKAVLGSFAGPDRLAVVAFADTPQLVHGPARPAEDAGAFRNGIEALESKGSTRIARALKFVREKVLPQAGGGRVARHVLLLSDGMPENPDPKVDVNEEMAAAREEAGRLAGSGATLSTVYTALEKEVDPGARELLRDLAKRGRGDSYHAKDLRKLAAIFLRDLSRFRSSVLEGRFRPAATADPLAGALGPLPEIEGRNRVSARKRARTVLEAPAPGGRGREPLLLVWERGRGRAACLATSFGEPWGKALAGADGKFLRTLVRWVAGRSGRSGCRLALIREAGGSLRLELVARDERGQPLEKLKPVAGLRDLQGRWNSTLRLLQESPSRYAARLSPPGGASELIAAARSGGGDLARGFFPLSYPRELARVGVDREGLEELARLAGGRAVSEPAALAGMEFARAAGRALGPAAPWLAVFALALVLAELAFRAVRR